MRDEGHRDSGNQGRGGPEHAPPQWRHSRGPRPTTAGPDPSPRAPSLTRHRAGLEVIDRLLHDVAVDPSGLVGVADEQTVVAEGIHDPREAVRVVGDPDRRLFAEDPGVVGPGQTKAGPDVVARSVARHARDGAEHADAL